MDTLAIEELLTRGVDKIYPSKEELEKVLLSGKKLTLYQGFDPTGTQLHIGHMVGFRKLRQWQDLGHKVIFLIGDGTGQAGDPSGKTKSRETFFSRDQLRQNATDYVMQASKIIRFKGDNAIEIRYNGDWLNKLDLPKLLDIAGHFTLQQLIERDLFQERMKNNEPVNLREFLYPLLQGYDSVEMQVDVELGGSDQTFNMLIGRQLVKDYLKKEKFVMTTPLLEDSQGRKIGKTEGNVIALNDNPNDLYAKILALGDDIIIKGLEYLTDVSHKEINQIIQEMKDGANPFQFKDLLATKVVEQLFDPQAANDARNYFSKVVQQKQLPNDIEEVTLSSDDEEIVNEDLLVDLNLASSKSEAKRLFQQGGVEVNGEKVTDPNKNISVSDGMVIKIGKRRMIKIKTAQ